MKQFTKEGLIEQLKAIHANGWVEGVRQPGIAGNAGSVGNTLETLLGIAENNLPLPNAAEWELKAKRRGASSFVTLLHLEPSPTAMQLVTNLLLPKYGWVHKTKVGENSFRQTINAATYSDRGFKVVINRDPTTRRVEVSFNASQVKPRHAAWLKNVEANMGLGELNPQPYWGFDDLEHKVGTKLTNAFFVLADSKKQAGKEYFFYNGIFMLKTFSFEKFLKLLEEGLIYVDFDASSSHNHGTKLRLSAKVLPTLYAESTTIVDAPLNRKDIAKLDVQSLASIAPTLRAEDLQTIEKAYEQSEPLDEDD